jgi:adenine-specific DNA methylase
MDEKTLDEVFENKFDQVISSLNMLKAPKSEYIAKYYCPVDDNNPDVKNERLFYTRYNGLIIDAVREKIDELYPDNGSLKNKKARAVLISLLVYEAATRSNTSGVFKGFHNGFGGSGKDALTRILKQIKLKRPVLLSSKHKNRVYSKDAYELSKKLSKIKVDIAYLDPPYNQHQYGSNYHLLNTVAYNDKPKVNKNVYINGKKVDKSAIRKDWVKTKSLYCYKKNAQSEFEKLLDKINARKILISYSTDGIIDFDNMLKILSCKGKLDIVCEEYVKYRGGKQALTSQARNVEFVLIVDTEKASSSSDIEKVREKLLKEKIDNVLKKTFNVNEATRLGWKVEPGKFYNRMKKDFYGLEADICLKNGFSYEKAEFRYQNDLNGVHLIESLPFEVKEKLYSELSSITDITKDIEISIFLNRIKELSVMKRYDEIAKIFKEIACLLKKFNNKKAYYSALKTIIKVLDVTHEVGIDALMAVKCFKVSLKKILKLIDLKLAVKRFDKTKEDEISFLKIRIKKKLVPILNLSEEFAVVSNM